MEINTLRQNKISLFKNYWNKALLNNKFIEAIENEDWEEAIKFIPSTTWALVGIYWSLVYSLDKDVFRKLGYVPLGAFAYTDIKEISLEYVDEIKDCAFYQSSLSEIQLSNKLKRIGIRALLTNESSIIHIRFRGTMKEFKSIQKGPNWYRDEHNPHSGIVYVVCDDGDLEYGG